ncbi:MAG: pyruvate kinase [Polyangiales bacterium]
MRRAKIVCTLGPASNSPEILVQLLEQGMNCARINFSHGDFATHSKTVQNLRIAMQKARRPCCILADLCGPKIRIGSFEHGSVQIERGDRFTLTTDDVLGDSRRVSVSYTDLPNDVRAGDAILIDDGLLRLTVESVNGNEVQTVVAVGGTISDHKGLNLPGVAISTPALTEKDRRDMRFAIDELQVNYIALSFVRSVDDVREAQQLAGDTPVIAKIEKPEAIDHLDAIIDASDGIMVARGDLGVEVGAEKVPLLQKRMIKTANHHGKLVITATQMLDSMIRNPRPTRAETADVANAVLDGTDAVMLSGETAVGRYPIDAVAMMGRIVEEVENDYLDEISRRFRELKIVAHADWEFPNAATKAAAVLSTHLPLNAIVVFTKDGRSARLLAEHRPRAPILAVTSDLQTAQRLALAWGVIPKLEVPPESFDETLRIANALVASEGLCEKGDAFALVAAWPTSDRTNMIKLHRL